MQAIITAKNSSVVYAPAVGAVRSTQPAVGLEGSRLYITLHIETLKRNARAHSIHLEAHAVPDLTSATPITQYAFVYCIDSTPPSLPPKVRLRQTKQAYLSHLPGRIYRFHPIRKTRPVYLHGSPGPSHPSHVR